MDIGFRLRRERERMGLSQEAFAALASVKKMAQWNYEKGDRSPDAKYLAAIAAAGVDVRYVLTGELSAASLSSDEKQLLELFRAAPLAVKMAAVGALQGASLAQATVTQQNHAEGSVQVGYVAGNNKVFKK